MPKQLDTAPLEDTLLALVGYTALLDDLTARKSMDDATLTADGINGLNRLLHHMRGLAVDALGNVPIKSVSSGMA